MHPIPDNPNFAVRDCCNTQSILPSWVKKVEVVCRIALGIFAAWLAPTPFAISFAIGVTFGAAYAIERFSRHQPMFPNGESKPVCAVGYMDFLTGMRFPPLVGSLATATFMGAHMRHDPQFYVPFCGALLGFWVGREATSAVRDMGGRAISFLNTSKDAVKTNKPSCCHI
jgi:hypothetical protein